VPGGLKFISSRRSAFQKAGGIGGGSELPSGGKLAKGDALKKAGITTSVANRCEKIAKIPEVTFLSGIKILLHRY